MRNLAFYPEDLKAEYESGDGWPEDAIEISQEQWEEFIGVPPSGKTLGSDISGMPAWVDISPPTHEQRVAVAELKKAELLAEAEATISIWQSKLLLGIISDKDKASLIEWLAYIDALNAIDTDTAPNINWPEMPEF